MQFNNLCFDSRRRNISSDSMKKYFSFTASQDWLYRLSFAAAGLRPVTADLGDGTIMHCWIPKSTGPPTKPPLLLIHGFGANAMWQYRGLLRHFTPHFSVYVPDLLFFGESTTARPERTEAFQAACVMRMMEALGASAKVRMVGISYGGFVAYSMASQFPEAVERVVLCCAGVCFEEKDLLEGLFVVADAAEAADVLVPQTPDRLRRLMELSFVKPVRGVPSYFLSDFIQVMCRTHVQEKKELIQALLRDRKLSNLPKIKQETLIIWGEHDRIFPLQLAYRLKRHLGNNGRLEVIKNAGHAVSLEKSKEFTRHVKSFLIDESKLLIGSHPLQP